MNARTFHRRAARRALAGLAPALLVAFATAGAAELYRWVEPDGSITFSPNRPPAGVDFDVVDAGGGGGGGAAPASIDASPVARVPSPVAPRDEIDAAAAASVAPVTAATVAGPAPAAAAPGVAYAPPPLGAAALGEGLRPAAADATATAAPDATRGTASEAPAAASDDASGSDPAAARRHAQCRELEKRVVSLERSLMLEMPPERMDDTVLSMARYQSSLDDHCGR